MNSEYTKKWLKVPSNIRTIVNNYMKRYDKPAYKSYLIPKGTNYKVPLNVYSIEQLEKQLSNKKRTSNAIEVAIHYLKYGEHIAYEHKTKYNYSKELERDGRDPNLVCVWKSSSLLRYRIYRFMGKDGHILDGERKFIEYYEDEYYKILNYLDDIGEYEQIKQFAIDTMKYTKYNNIATYTALLKCIKNSFPTHNKKRLKSMSLIRKVIKRYEKSRNR